MLLAAAHIDTRVTCKFLLSTLPETHHTPLVPFEMDAFDGTKSSRNMFPDGMSTLACCGWLAWLACLSNFPGHVPCQGLADQLRGGVWVPGEVRRHPVLAAQLGAA